VLIPHLVRQIFTTESLAWTYRLRTFVIFISVIAYVISPLDILPESVLGIFGLLDDFFIVLCTALYVVVTFRQHLAGA
jgi:RING finger protein 170